ncbi:DegT/DnrJ/EryC1/StrS family aminotransferase [Glacieibacterium frigidum]|uniref:GDP-perosamine synthase n=1 Tax=Glacieibacterium frigidum TaxID=2593303 RepID=A0A552UG90_9SPHN|nr:DegT/DnrJ/EryC1/StrS family aminotransferase [Glacieibacterium frigidum]TRW17199.1 DegT/DnrJ/EryC1/StrS family aminotransferase [Glacieibacterium frigidum]
MSDFAHSLDRDGPDERRPTASRRIPLAQPDLGVNEEAYVLEALRSGWITSRGKFVDRFEREFADAVGSAGALAVCNGTSALYLAMLGLGIGPGDEVLVPSLSFVATANAVRFAGAEPVFVDIDPATWCIDPQALAAAITPRTRAILAVHLYGHPADMDAINVIAAQHGLFVVEDAAEAFGATYKGRPVGALGDVGVFSFYGNKILTAGEGGAVTAADPRLLARMRLLRGQGMDPDRQYFYPVIGHNFRPTNIACALLCAQLERAPTMLSRRRQIFALYRKGLAGIAGIGRQPVTPDARQSPWLFSMTIDAVVFGMSRDALMARLAALGIETRPFFIPSHQLPPYLDAATRQGAKLPVTDRVAASGINLPTFTTLPDAAIAEICAAIRKLASRGEAALQLSA